jgi:hypothetical protein
MKIEVEWPEDEIQLRSLSAPQLAGGPAYRHLPEDHPDRPWLAYVKSLLCPHYYGAHGQGRTPQAAVDDAVRQVREYLARHPQGQYNVSKAPEVDLDISFLDDL